MKRILILVLGVSAASSVIAQSAYAPSDAELASLPPICTIKLRPSPLQKSYAEQYGSNWQHMHHYCFGVNFANRARFSRDATGRNDNFKESIANYYYMIDHTDRSFWMRPQIHVEMGRVYLRMNKRIEAAKDFAAAIAANPRYEPAYLPLIETYRALGSTSAALEVATAGLRYFPNSKALRESYLAVGGKMPFPEPLSEPAPAAVAVPKDTDAHPGESGRSLVEAGGNTVASPGDESAETSSAVPLERGCRFCPPDEIRERWRESFGEKSKQ